MGVAKKIVLGALVIVLGIILIGLAAVAHNAYAPPRSVGVQQVLVQSPGLAPIPTTIFYPSNGSPRWKWAGLWAAKLAPDGSVEGAKLPLIVLSHGTGGTSFSHLDTALALAQAGYVVAAPLHSGDNYLDDAIVGRPEWFQSRSKDVQRVDDYMLGQWPDRTHLDPDKLGFFGFSAGATTGLIAIGGEPDLGLIRTHCATDPEFVCTLLKQSGDARPGKPATWSHDPRLRAAVIVAPGLGFAFPRSGLKNVRAPVQLWQGDQDKQVPPASNAAAIEANLPARPEMHVVTGAGHSSFLPPCGALSIALPKLLCADQADFDRKAFHRSFNAAVVRFFNQKLDHR